MASYHFDNLEVAKGFRKKHGGLLVTHVNRDGVWVVIISGCHKMKPLGFSPVELPPKYSIAKEIIK